MDIAAPRMSRSPLQGAGQQLASLEENVAKVIKGKREVVRGAIAALLTRGHLLIEDVPGVGKTMLAQALAKSLGLSFHRIQFTSDLLPSDIMGVSIYNQKTQEFEFISGPVFSNIVLADEINRATPKTQSALLEAMSEGTVTLEKARYVLPPPFMVIATQNPVEYLGTYPLPESQLDRFVMKIEIGYPAHEDERALLMSGGVEEALRDLRPVLQRDEVLALQALTESVTVAPKLVDYMMAIVAATRCGGELRLGVSTRGAQALYRSAQALALIEGRGFAIPDDIKRLAVSVLSHRVMVDGRDAGGRRDREAERIVERIVAATPIPL